MCSMQTGVRAVAPESAPMLEVRGLGKRFGARVAVADVSFTIRHGELFGLLGHNGAGKSTTIGTILGQIYPDAGTVRISGRDVFRQRRQALARVGAIFETPCFYDYMSGWENLVFFSQLTRLTSCREIEQAVQRVGLTARIHDPVRKYSHGMRQRLALAQALLPDPEFLILDEPTDGLDPEGIAEMRSLILDLNERDGLTILLCSHQLDEVQRMCRRVAVLKEGHLVFEGDWRSAEAAGGEVDMEVTGVSEPMRELERAGLVMPDGHLWRLRPGRDVADCVEYFSHLPGVRIHRAGLKKPSLEDFYLRLTHQGEKRS